MLSNRKIFSLQPAAGRRVQDDAARLLSAAGSFPQLSNPVAGLAGKGSRDRRAADEAPAPGAADPGAVRRLAAAGGARGTVRAARRDLSTPDAPHC